ncbi:MAG TPA: ATP-dependent zinc metalloprotease FtsH [bacterium]|nr:ATP-dependent zinc metalloprotease FtsH [bacterium]
MKRTLRGLLPWLIIILAVATVYQFFVAKSEHVAKIPYWKFTDLLAKGVVATVTLQENKITGELSREARTEGDAKPFTMFKTQAPVVDSDFVAKLEGAGVKVDTQDARSMWFTILVSVGPYILLFAFFIWLFRRMQSPNNKALSFGKSRARLFDEGKQKVTFEDVAGAEEAKEELQEIIEFLKDPRKFQRLGGKIPKGVLLVGPPGSGKTLMGKAVAGEAGVPFLSISGSDFVEMFVGVGASRVRDLFDEAKKRAPCIVFIDELDAVGRLRGAGLGGGHDEREQTLNQLLVEMDGFESNEGVILLAATNRPDVLDPALLRPGRFDRTVVVDRPDIKGRLGILQVHTREIPLAADVDLEMVARGTPYFSGADLANLVNEAALLAARKDRDEVTRADMEEARDKVMMGPERKSHVISEKEKEIAAYHEVGHALVAKLTPGSDRVHKVTIIPRGMALGLTQSLPEEEKHMYSKEFCEILLDHMMGGRAAEMLVFDQETSGAGNDIERATELARKMVCDWGMSDTLGPVAFGKREEAIFLGREIAQHRDYSEETAQTIDGEIRRIVEAGYARAHKLLKKNKTKLELIAKELLERETLTGDEIDTLLAGKQLPPFTKQPVAKKKVTKEGRARKMAPKTRRVPDAKPALETE